MRNPEGSGVDMLLQYVWLEDNAEFLHKKILKRDGEGPFGGLTHTNIG